MQVNHSNGLNSYKIILVLLFVICGSALAEDQTELRYDYTTDIAITSIGVGAWVGSTVFQGRLATSTCRWCDDNRGDRFFRDHLKWNNTRSADLISGVTAFAGAPLAAYGLNGISSFQEDRQRNFLIDALIITEATVLAVDLNQIVKISVGRERPFVHALPASQKSKTNFPADNNMSFYSGHTTLAFAFTFSSGTVASMRGYKMAPWIWGTGLVASTATAYLRIAADKHYFTDVLVGAVMGSAVGFAVPYFFHSPEKSSSSVRVSVIPVTGGGVLLGSISL